MTNFDNCHFNRTDRRVYFFKGHTERQHENDDVADGTCEQAVTACGKAYLRSYPVKGIERVSVTPGNFDPRNESGSADLANIRQALQRVQSLGEMFDLRLQLFQDTLLLKDSKIGQRRGAAQRIPTIAVAVEKGFERGTQKSRKDTICRESSGQWEVTAGQSFGER